MKEADTYLRGLRVLELGTETTEYAGKLLAGLGADVVKVEPVGGEPTRAYGPFYRDLPDPNRSLYFWHYNHGKRGIVLDLDGEPDRERLRRLVEAADVVLDGRPRGYLDERGLGYDQLRASNPALVYCRLTAFGETGPWADYTGSDLVHLALGGMMMNSGYDPDPFMNYDTPPIAPQMWQAYHVAGELMVMSALAAVDHALHTGEGQYLSGSAHQANAGSTESDHPMWIALRIPYRRQTSRHASPILSVRGIAPTKDGRYLLPYTTYVQNFPDSWEQDLATLRAYGMQEDLDAPEWSDSGYRARNAHHIADVMDKLIKRLPYDAQLWREMNEKGLTWAPVRPPEELLADPHWHARETYATVEHPELGESFTYVGARWFSAQVHWSTERRAPLVGEHDDEVFREWSRKRAVSPRHPRRADVPATRGRRTGALPLEGLRVVDLSWMLASAGAGRFLASMGAEVIKVEHMSRLDGMRFAGMPYPPRAERDAATGPMPYPQQTSVNQSANFNEINVGKLAMSLNLKSSDGLRILEDLIRSADFVVEGYSPGTMERMGLGYERLRELNPGIVYIQQSGLGQRGIYPKAKAFGPTAQAFSGLTDMSGLPSPWPPAGIGYSYLDWFGAYNMATAALAAHYRRELTGEGCWIDASQVEVGVYLQGTALLDYTVNGRPWARYGNDSPYKPAGPHGVFRAEGRDRWVAIACFTQEQWRALTEVLGHPEWIDDPRFATLSDRRAHAAALGEAISAETVTWERYRLMQALQERGVPAGVAQDAQDRVENDPQLASDRWLIELEHSEFGSWPARTHPVRFSRTPLHAGGVKDRHAPCYGEDTDEVLGRILGLDASAIAQLRESGAV